MQDFSRRALKKWFFHLQELNWIIIALWAGYRSANACSNPL